MEIPPAKEEKIRLLRTHCPGFLDYESVENRKDSDALLREMLMNRINSLRSRLQKLLYSLEREREGETYQNIQLLHNDLYRLIHRLRFTSYGNTSFFTDLELEEEELNALYECDLSLLHSLQKMEESLTHLERMAENRESVLPHVRGELYWSQELDEGMDLRARIILHRKRKGESWPGSEQE